VDLVSSRLKGSRISTFAPMASQTLAMSNSGSLPIGIDRQAGWDWNPVMAVPLLSTTTRVT